MNGRRTGAWPRKRQGPGVPGLARIRLRGGLPDDHAVGLAALGRGDLEHNGLGLCGLRVGVEKSVFECDLSEENFRKLWAGLVTLVEDEDAVAAYRICVSCVRKVESLGTFHRPERKMCYVL